MLLSGILNILAAIEAAIDRTLAKYALLETKMVILQNFLDMVAKGNSELDRISFKLDELRSKTGGMSESDSQGALDSVTALVSRAATVGLDPPPDSASPNVG